MVAWQYRERGYIDGSRCKSRNDQAVVQREILKIIEKVNISTEGGANAGKEGGYIHNIYLTIL